MFGNKGIRTNNKAKFTGEITALALTNKRLSDENNRLKDEIRRYKEREKAVEKLRATYEESIVSVKLAQAKYEELYNECIEIKKVLKNLN